MTARWYERNFKIASNVLRLIDAPTDRVLVLIGAAHGPILREILSGVPGVRVIPPGEALRDTSGR
jgi:pheromone shutdown protein TraB